MKYFIILFLLGLLVFSGCTQLTSSTNKALDNNTVAEQAVNVSDEITGVGNDFSNLIADI